MLQRTSALIGVGRWKKRQTSACNWLEHRLKASISAQKAEGPLGQQPAENLATNRATAGSQLLGPEVRDSQTRRFHPFRFCPVHCSGGCDQFLAHGDACINLIDFKLK